MDNNCFNSECGTSEQKYSAEYVHSKTNILLYFSNIWLARLVSNDEWGIDIIIWRAGTFVFFLLANSVSHF